MLIYYNELYAKHSSLVDYTKNLRDNVKFVLDYIRVRDPKLVEESSTDFIMKILQEKSDFFTKFYSLNETDDRSLPDPLNIE